MKTERNILVAFILNLAFALFEFFGGVFTGSVAIVSDAVHDAGDAVSIGVSYFLERKSKKKPDDRYTFGYARYSVVGGVFTTIVLIVGSVLVVYNAVCRIITPADINYDGMISFAIVGVCVNFCAVLFTRDGDSLNQKAVNLHMLEDLFGWIVVLIGAIVMRFTDIAILDPLMSIGVALFIFVNAAKNLKSSIDVFLEKTPAEVDIPELTEHLRSLDGVVDVHHLHVWSLDGCTSCATMHAVVRGEVLSIKRAIREELAEHGISHATLELEREGETGEERRCNIGLKAETCHHHHHHHH